MIPKKDKRPHIVVSNTARTEKFTTPNRGGGNTKLRSVDRAQHGQELLNQLDTIKEDIEKQEPCEGIGLRLEFESAQNVDDFPFERLARDKQGIEILNVRSDQGRTFVTLFVPDGKLVHFENMIKEYLTENTKKGEPKNNPLINAIEQIHTAAFDGLWTDDKNVLPASDDETIWWEIWLPVRQDRREILQFFKIHAERIGIQVSSGYLEFPERTILTARTSKAKLQCSTLLLNSIAEIRRVKETAEFFEHFPLQEQHEWTREALTRIRWPRSTAPSVCILDTGINNGHPLLSPILADEDRHTVEPDWSVDDRDGHGSGMAGLAAYGDLTEFLSSSDRLDVSHRLESVKILRESGDNVEKHHGELTKEGIYRAEITAPYRQRILCMAVTSKDSRDRGKPSAWSGVIDRMASGAEDDKQRLIIISAGNVAQNTWQDYPNSNATDSIHDPGQAWNALTVGAYTLKDQLPSGGPENAELLAPVGGLSPSSTTSATWKGTKWPLKPDIVFEGGNAIKDSIFPTWAGSLSLLSTSHEPTTRLFDYFNATSAATALACRMAAKIQASYPNLWPETIRALLVHSADWTDTMRQMFLDGTKKTHYENLIRYCGFGVPNLDKALWSAGNALTLIAQDSLQPFEKENSRGKTRDMHLHSLPWPHDALESLGEITVQMRVTLSYFIEPNPSERGFLKRYAYTSHGLRFDVKRPEEPVQIFRERINRAARDEEEGTKYGGADSDWLLGSQKRHLGSIHSDIWEGTATDLANRGYIAVYPTGGWWKERLALQRYNKQARYALVVSIYTPETDIDIYTPVEAEVVSPVKI